MLGGNERMNSPNLCTGAVAASPCPGQPLHVASQVARKCSWNSIVIKIQFQLLSQGASLDTIEEYFFFPCKSCRQHALSAIETQSETQGFSALCSTIPRVLSYPHIHILNRRKGRGGREGMLLLFKSTIGKLHVPLCSHPFSQNLVPWSHVAAKEDGKCAVLFWWPVPG